MKQTSTHLTKHLVAQRVLGSRGVLGATALLVIAVGCGNSEPPGTLGEVGNGSFQYGCVEGADVVCTVTDEAPPELRSALTIAKRVPTRVAVGARFDLRFDGGEAAASEEADTSDTEAPFVETKPASAATVDASSGFRILVAGTHAFLAASRDGMVADFVHVVAEEPSELEIFRAHEAVDAITLTVGDSITLTGAPVNATGALLGGATDLTWLNQDDTVVGLETIKGDQLATRRATDITVVARAEGSTKVVLQLDTLTKELDLIVQAAAGGGS